MAREMKEALESSLAALYPGLTDAELAAAEAPEHPRLVARNPVGVGISSAQQWMSEMFLPFARERRPVVALSPESKRAGANPVLRARAWGEGAMPRVVSKADAEMFDDVPLESVMLFRPTTCTGFRFGDRKILGFGGDFEQTLVIGGWPENTPKSVRENVVVVGDIRSHLETEPWPAAGVMGAYRAQDGEVMRVVVPDSWLEPLQRLARCGVIVFPQLEVETERMRSPDAGGDLKLTYPDPNGRVNSGKCLGGLIFPMLERSLGVCTAADMGGCGGTAGLYGSMISGAAWHIPAYGAWGAAVGGMRCIPDELNRAAGEIEVAYRSVEGRIREENDWKRKWAISTALRAGAWDVDEVSRPRVEWVPYVEVDGRVVHVFGFKRRPVRHTYTCGLEPKDAIWMEMIMGRMPPYGVCKEAEDRLAPLTDDEVQYLRGLGLWDLMLKLKDWKYRAAGSATSEGVQYAVGVVRALKILLEERKTIEMRGE